MMTSLVENGKPWIPCSLAPNLLLTYYLQLTFFSSPSFPAFGYLSNNLLLMMLATLLLPLPPTHALAAPTVSDLFSAVSPMTEVVPCAEMTATVLGRSSPYAVASLGACIVRTTTIALRASTADDGYYMAASTIGAVALLLLHLIPNQASPGV